jgi:hypothetical protein
MDLSAFGKIAQYLANPLVLIGFVLFLAFGIHRALISSGIIPPLDQAGGSVVVRLILRYGFLLAVLLIVLGFGYAYFSGINTETQKVDNEIMLLRSDREEKTAHSTLSELIEYCEQVPKISQYAVTQLKSYLIELEQAGDDLSRFKRKEIVAAIKKLAADNMANLFSNHELTKMDLLGIDLKNANLNHVDFEGAFLIETNFSGANLDSANLSETFIRNVDFTNANLKNADLTDADWFNAIGITEAQLASAKKGTVIHCPNPQNIRKYEKDNSCLQEPYTEYVMFHRYLNCYYMFSYHTWGTAVQRQLISAWS